MYNCPFIRKEYQMLDGTKLKFLRYTMGKTQAQVAKWCNVSTRYIKFIEHNEMTPSEELYHAFLNCIYGIGKPLPQEPRPNQTSKKKSGDTDGTIQ